MAKDAEESLRDHLTAKYKREPDFQWGVIRSWQLGGDDPFEQVWAFSCDDEQPHWHYVGAGLADPAKVDADDDDPESGMGYELTFRVKKGSEKEPPLWPVKRMQEIGWGVLKHNMNYDVGHYIRQRKPLDEGSNLTGYYVFADKPLGTVQCESGEFRFLQLVGMTHEELVRCEDGDADGMEADLREASPLGVTDIKR